MLKGNGQKVYIQIGELNFEVESKSKWFEFKKNIRFTDSKTKKTLSISINNGEVFIANCSLMPKNTYFGFSGADTFLVATGGTTALTIDSSQDATFAGQVNVAETLKIGGATSGTKTLIFESQYRKYPKIA